jgi:hypothetical protein
MSRSPALQAAIETEDFHALERHFPFASLMIALVVASQVASTVMLIAQR